MRLCRLLILSGVIIMTGCATTYHAGAPTGAIDVIAHRGASACAPENTMAAFRAAKEQNADWFELDCTLTKDGEVLVIHDDDLERTTNGEGDVAATTLADLKKLDAGSWHDAKFAGERLPTLGESLDFAKQAEIGVYVEIKNSDDDSRLIERFMEMAEGRTKLNRKLRRSLMALIEESGSRNVRLTREVIRLIRERGMKHYIVIQSFSPIICAVAFDEAPELRTEFLGSKDDDHPERWPMFLAWTGWLRPAGCNVSNDTLNREALASFQRDGYTVAVWTVDEEADMRRLARWGVDAIITNKPADCLRVLEEAGKR